MINDWVPLELTVDSHSPKRIRVMSVLFIYGQFFLFLFLCTLVIKLAWLCG